MIKWPEKKLKDNITMDRKWLGWNQAIDACISAEKSGRMSMEQIMDIVGVVNLNFSDERGYKMHQVKGLKGHAFEVANAIYITLYGDSQTTERGGSNVKDLK